jgi:hypothetical protein
MPGIRTVGVTSVSGFGLRPSVYRKAINHRVLSMLKRPLVLVLVVVLVLGL